jgi:pimeloyl-ACP methyl ester carboxylesterase
MIVRTLVIFRRSILLTPLLLAMLLLGGCISFLADRMVAPPNGHDSAHPPLALPNKLGKNEWRVPVGESDKAAILAVWVLDPKDLKSEGGKAGDPAKDQPKGTVLCLHGFEGNHQQVARAGKALQKAGYRAVLVDLRGHGKSTGDHITYGVQDAEDLKELTTFLQRHGLCGATVGVFGTSYGAAAGILHAGVDPRVTAVVAVAPFATLREAAPYFGRHVMPVPGAFLSDGDYARLLEAMGKEGHFNPDDASPLAAIGKTGAHIRLFAGADDKIVSPTAAKELAAADPERTELTVVAGKGHLELCLDWFGQLHGPTRAWFDEHLAKGGAAEAR